MSTPKRASPSRRVKELFLTWIAVSLIENLRPPNPMHPAKIPA